MPEQKTLSPEAQISLDEAAARGSWDSNRVETAQSELLDKHGLTPTGIKEELLDTGASELDPKRKAGLDALADAAIAEAASRGDWSQDKVDEVKKQTTLIDKNR